MLRRSPEVFSQGIRATTFISVFSPLLFLSLYGEYYKVRGPQIITYMAFSNFSWDAENERKLMVYSTSYVVKECGYSMNCAKL